MIPACTSSRGLTLSNAIQGVFRAEIARQRFGASAYNRQQRPTPTRTTTKPRSLVSQRLLSSSAVTANKNSISTSDATVRRNLNDEESLLTELTSEKTKRNNSTQSANSKNSTAKHTDEHKSKSARAKTVLQNGMKEQKPNKKPTSFLTSPPKKVKREPWQIQKKALEEKFNEGWFPRKKLSPDTLDTIRHLNATKPLEWTTPALAAQFKVSPEAIRRILKSKWTPSEEERRRREERWHKRHERIWSHMEQLGLRPKKGEPTAQVSDARRLGLSSPASSSEP